jgi:hypothetical protein
MELFEDSSEKFRQLLEESGKYSFELSKFCKFRFSIEISWPA